jgi:hypothetical protein
MLNGGLNASLPATGKGNRERNAKDERITLKKGVKQEEWI